MNVSYYQPLHCESEQYLMSSYPIAPPEKSLEALEEYMDYDGDDADELNDLADRYIDAVEKELRQEPPPVDLSFFAWLKEQFGIAKGE